MNPRWLKIIVLCLVFLLKLFWLNFEVAHAGELSGTAWNILVPTIKGGEEDLDDPWPLSFNQVKHKGSKISAIYKFGEKVTPVKGTINKTKKGYAFSLSSPGSKVVFSGKLIPVSSKEYSSESTYERQLINTVTSAGGKIVWKITDGVMYIKHSKVKIFKDRPKGKGSYAFIGHVVKNGSKGAKKVDNKAVTAVIETKFGEIEVKFFPEVAPKHVENFVTLAKQGFYDGTIFHRVIPGFMIQGGDPNTKGANTASYGTGGPGHTVKAEFNNTRHTRGILSMARSQNPDSAGSQFFIVVKDSFFLDGQYTVFGEVVKGMDVVDQIVNLPRNPRDLPNERAEMKVRIVE